MSTLADLTDNSESRPNYRVQGTRIPWRRDPIVLARLAEVQRRHSRGESNLAIAAALGVDEKVIRVDLMRLGELWTARIGAEAEVLRGQVVTELDEIKGKALDAAAFDEWCERAVLFGESATGQPIAVERDEKGAAKYSGQKAQNLNTARQAVMDKAKVLGVIVDKGDGKVDRITDVLAALAAFGRGEYDEPARPAPKAIAGPVVEDEPDEWGMTPP